PPRRLRPPTRSATTSRTPTPSASDAGLSRARRFGQAPRAMRPHLLLVIVALSGCRDAPAVDPLIEPVPEAAPASPRVSAPAGSVFPGEEERARVETRHRDQGCEPSAADAKPLELVKLQL